MKNRTNAKKGMPKQYLKNTKQCFKRHYFKNDGGISDRIVLKWVPIVDRYSAVIVYGGVDIYRRASVVYGSVVSCIMAKSSVMFACMGVWLMCVCGGVKDIYQVAGKRLGYAFAECSEYDIYGIEE